MKALLVTREQALAIQARLRAAVATDGSDLVQVGSGPHVSKDLCRTREAVEVVELKDGTAEVFVPARFEARLAKGERDALAPLTTRLTSLR